MAHFSVEAAAESEEMQELARDTGAPETKSELTAPEGKTVLVGRFGARSRVDQATRWRSPSTPAALHFFDPETGLGIYDGNEKGDAG